MQTFADRVSLVHSRGRRGRGAGAVPACSSVGAGVGVVYGAHARANDEQAGVLIWLVPWQVGGGGRHAEANTHARVHTRLRARLASPRSLCIPDGELARFVARHALVAGSVRRAQYRHAACCLLRRPRPTLRTVRLTRSSRAHVHRPCVRQERPGTCIRHQLGRRPQSAANRKRCF